MDSDRRALRLLVGREGGTGSDAAAAWTRALAETTDVELIGAGSDEAAGLKGLAAAESADLIVLSGAAHSTGPTRSPPGPIEDRVLDGAPCAVAVVPPGHGDAGVSLRTIAVGYDGSRASAIALGQAIELAERSGASLLILGATESIVGLAGYEPRQSTDLDQERMERHLQRALKSVPPTVSTDSRLLIGPPGRALVEGAKQADLLVLGSRSSYAPRHHLVLGSVAREVLRSATTPTLVTPDD